MAVFTKPVLYTGADGGAHFRDETVALTEGTPQVMLSPVLPTAGCQLRHSPVGFRSPYHCTITPQWIIVLDGEMEIGLHDGTTPIFRRGDLFYSTDTLPGGATFDPAVHGHWSAQRGDSPLVTLFVRG